MVQHFNVDVSHNSTDSGGNQTTNMVSDITERRRAEALLNAGNVFSPNTRHVRDPQQQSPTSKGSAGSHPGNRWTEVVPHDAATIMLIEETRRVVRSQGYGAATSRKKKIIGVK